MPSPQRTRTPAISLQAREIFFINIKPYEFYCFDCGAVNSQTITCRGCSKPLNIDRTQKGKRPVVIVHAPVSNLSDEENSLVLVIPITSNLEITPGSVIIPANDVTKLKRPGRAKVFQLTSYDRRKFFEEDKWGVVPDDEWKEIKDKLKVLLKVDDTVLRIDGIDYHSGEIKQILEVNKQIQKVSQDLEKTQKDLETEKYRTSELRKGEDRRRKEFETRTEKKYKQEISELKRANQVLSSEKERLNRELEMERKLKNPE